MTERIPPIGQGSSNPGLVEGHSSANGLAPAGETGPSSGDGRLDPSGVAAAFAAFFTWGLMPLFFLALAPAGPLEILAHRALWCLPVMAIALVVAGRWGLVRMQLSRPRVWGALTATTLLIGGNWFIYIWATQTGRILEASLAYFINPLMSMLLGAALLGERLSFRAKIAVGLAAVGVINQAVVVGQAPYVSVLLAALFAGYGFLRKVAKVDAGPGLLAETTLMAPFAIGVIVWLELSGAGHFTTHPRTALLLLAAGPLTAAPLFFFAVGARRLPLFALGLLQYLAPTMQFVIGLANGEAFSSGHAVTFIFIWAGLLLFTLDTIYWRDVGKTSRP